MTTGMTIAGAVVDTTAIEARLGMMPAAHMLEMIIVTAVERTVGGLLEGESTPIHSADFKDSRFYCWKYEVIQEIFIFQV